MRTFYACLIIALFSNYTTANSQVINGTWTGNYSRTLFNMNPSSLVIELSVHNDSILSGASHLFYGSGRYEHHKITGKFNPRDSSAKFFESLIETNLSMGVFEVFYDVKLISNGANWRLEGRWKNTNSRFGFMPFNKVWLEKPKDTLSQKDITIKPIVPNLTVPVIIQKDSIKLNRKADLQKIIEISKKEKDSIHLAVYDNGEIDNDTISVYLNDIPVLMNSMITDKPLSIYLSLDKDKQFQKIKMVAENLGSVPPNTAIMIITTKQKRYEVRLSSDLDKNAVVEFVLLD